MDLKTLGVLYLSYNAEEAAPFGTATLIIYAW